MGGHPCRAKLRGNAATKAAGAASGGTGESGHGFFSPMSVLKPTFKIALSDQPFFVTPVGTETAYGHFHSPNRSVLCTPNHRHELLYGCGILINTEVMAEAISCCSKKRFKICYLSLESSVLFSSTNAIAEQVCAGNEDTSAKVNVG